MAGEPPPDAFVYVQLQHEIRPIETEWNRGGFRAQWCFFGSYCKGKGLSADLSTPEARAGFVESVRDEAGDVARWVLSERGSGARRSLRAARAACEDPKLCLVR
jgi:hypothetical protein